jgi:hypothetical protein
MPRRAINEFPVETAMKRRLKHGHLPAIALLIVLTFGLCATVVRADDSGGGTIHVSGNQCYIHSIYIDNYQRTSANVTHVTVDAYKYMVVLNASDADLLTDIRKIEVQLYTSTSNYNDTGDIRHHYSFVWTSNSGFANVGPSGSYFDAASSTSLLPTLTNPTGLFKFVFKLDKLAIYTDTVHHHWIVTAYIWDNENNQDTLSNTFDVYPYQSIIINTSVSWSNLAQGSSLNHATSDDSFPATWTYTCNYKAKIQIYATVPTNAYGNTFEVGNVTLATSSDHGANETAFTLTNADWLTNLPNNADQSIPVYWFVDIPQGQPTGTYTFTYTITITIDTYAD